MWTLLVSLKPSAKRLLFYRNYITLSLFGNRKSIFFYKLFLQTSRSIGRKSSQSCLRCIACLVFKVTVLGKLMVTSPLYGELPWSDFSGCYFLIFHHTTNSYCLSTVLEENNLLRLCTKVWKAKTNAIHYVNTNFPCKILKSEF